MLIRQKYLKRIRPYYDSELIKVITGIRRCGKSTILKQIIQEIKKTIRDNERIIFFDLEDYANEKYLNDPHAFYNTITNSIKSEKKAYIFLDEIQYLKDFEKVIASIRKLNCSLFVTGSNSKLLSGELASHLTGRVIEFNIQPFTYSEASVYVGEENDDFINEYLQYGGFPLRFEEKSTDPFLFSKNLYDSILDKDIFSRHAIEDKNKFRNFASYVMLHSGETISTKSIENYTKSVGETITKSSGYQYLDYMEEAYLNRCCFRYDINGKQVLSTRKKYYATDTSLIRIQKNSDNQNLGFLLETVVFNELISRGYNVSIGKTYKGEIDFVVSHGKNICYIQTCYLLATDEIVEREFGAFSSIKDYYPKYVISMDKLDMSRNGIKHLNLRKFLLDEGSIE